MPERTASPVITDGRAAPPVSSLHRSAGWGAVLAAVAYLDLPVAVSFLYSDPGVNYDSVAYIAGNGWNGAVERIIFAGLGIGLLFLVVAVGRIARADRHPVTVAAQVAHGLGLLSAGAWILVGGVSMGKYSSVAAATGERLPEVGDQAAVIAAIDIVITGLVATAALAIAGWLVGLATAGRRAGVLGSALAVTCALAAAVIVVPMLVLAMPFGVLVLIPL
jgi:hypothetical protein